MDLVQQHYKLMHISFSIAALNMWQSHHMDQAYHLLSIPQQWRSTKARWAF